MEGRREERDMEGTKKGREKKRELKKEEERREDRRREKGRKKKKEEREMKRGKKGEERREGEEERVFKHLSNNVLIGSSERFSESLTLRKLPRRVLVLRCVACCVAPRWGECCVMVCSVAWLYCMCYFAGLCCGVLCSDVLPCVV